MAAASSTSVAIRVRLVRRKGSNCTSTPGRSAPAPIASAMRAVLSHMRVVDHQHLRCRPAGDPVAVGGQDLLRCGSARSRRGWGRSSDRAARRVSPGTGPRPCRRA